MPYRMMRALAAAGEQCQLLCLRADLFPGDRVNPSWGHCRELMDRAEVVHVHGLTTFGLLEPELRGRAFLVHVHGGADRDEPCATTDFPHVVATPDLLQQYPRAVFMPNLVLSEDLPRARPLGQGPVRVFKSPSCHPKHQQLCGQLMERIAGHLGPAAVQYVAPQGLMPHADLARLRASCQISLDHLHGYYGLESLESLAQGLVAINGATARCLEQVAQVVGQAPPFAVARDAESLAQLLVDLVLEALTEPARFCQRQARGPQFISRHYGVEQFVERWRELYRAAMGQRAGPTCTEACAADQARPEQGLASVLLGRSRAPRGAAALVPSAVPLLEQVHRTC